VNMALVGVINGETRACEFTQTSIGRKLIKRN